MTAITCSVWFYEVSGIHCDCKGGFSPKVIIETVLDCQHWFLIHDI
mgnify:FL=1